jgi:hypothetical protein
MERSSERRYREKCRETVHKDRKSTYGRTKDRRPTQVKMPMHDDDDDDDDDDAEKGVT